jgi:hypothetical protein
VQYFKAFHDGPVDERLRVRGRPDVIEDTRCKRIESRAVRAFSGEWGCRIKPSV